MSLILVVGVPGSGKTTLANNLKKKLDEMGKESVVVTEPQVESGAFDSSDAERLARSNFKNSLQHELSSTRVVIADGMNFIKGFRYELFCLAREAGLKWCVAFCDVDEETARIRSESRYTNKERLTRLINRMETPKASTKFDTPLFVVKDPNDQNVIDSILKQTFAKASVLIAKKATNSCAENAHLNDKIDQIINNFCEELIKMQKIVPIGTTLTICGASVNIKRIFNLGQLKAAKREFATRAKSLTDEKSIVQLFADSLSLMH